MTHPGALGGRERATGIDYAAQGSRRASNVTRLLLAFHGPIKENKSRFSGFSLGDSDIGFARAGSIVDRRRPPFGTERVPSD